MKFKFSKPFAYKLCRQKTDKNYGRKEIVLLVTLFDIFNIFRYCYEL